MAPAAHRRAQGSITLADAASVAAAALEWERRTVSGRIELPTGCVDQLQVVGVGPSAVGALVVLLAPDAGGDAGRRGERSEQDEAGVTHWPSPTLARTSLPPARMIPSVASSVDSQ